MLVTSCAGRGMKDGTAVKEVMLVMDDGSGIVVMTTTMERNINAHRNNKNNINNKNRKNDAARAPFFS